MTKSELKSIIKECVEEILLDESVKFTKKTSGKYTYYISNKSIKGIQVYIEEEDYENLDEKLFEKCFNIINKNYSKCLDQASKDMFKHAKSCELDIKYKSEDELKKALNLESVLYCPTVNAKEYVADFRMTFDTHPYLDPSHVYTLIATINKDFTVSCDDYEYDG